MKTKHSKKIETLKNSILAAINGAGSESAEEIRATALKKVKAFIKTIHGVMVLAKEPQPTSLSNN